VAEDVRPDRRLLVAIAAVTLLLRATYIWRFHVDADEPQHLHVVWGLDAGLGAVQRSLRQPHSTLPRALRAGPCPRRRARHGLSLDARGELPLYFVALWSCYRIGCALFSRSVGLCAAFILALLPPFFLTSIEFSRRKPLVVFGCWRWSSSSTERHSVRGWAVGALLRARDGRFPQTSACSRHFRWDASSAPGLLASPVERAYARSPPCSQRLPVLRS